MSTALRYRRRSSPTSTTGRRLALRAGGRAVLDVAWDDVSVAGVELEHLIADAHGHRSADHEPQLLVLMLVLRRYRVGREVDDGHRHARAFDSASPDAVRENDRLQLRQLLEGAHSMTRSMIVAVPMPPPQHIVSSP